MCCVNVRDQGGRGKGGWREEEKQNPRPGAASIAAKEKVTPNCEGGVPVPFSGEKWTTFKEELGHREEGKPKYPAFGGGTFLKRGERLYLQVKGGPGRYSMWRGEVPHGISSFLSWG